MREVAQKVATGEAQARIVYQTDVTPGIADKVEIVELPSRYVVPAENYAAVLRKTFARDGCRKPRFGLRAEWPSGGAAYACSFYANALRARKA